MGHYLDFGVLRPKPPNPRMELGPPNLRRIDVRAGAGRYACGVKRRRTQHTLLCCEWRYKGYSSKVSAGCRDHEGF